jgi:REP element-mobilizing transposase RayT
VVPLQLSCDQLGKKSDLSWAPLQGERITRRHLPHWQVEGATYFLTWRCVLSVTLAAPERDIVLAAIRHWDNIRWSIYTAVVMPDHVHLIARPLSTGDGCWDLGQLIHSVKSYSAHQVNRHRQRRGRIWQDERYDRWLRDENEFEQKWNYIAENPRRAGLVISDEPYAWLYQMPY